MIFLKMNVTESGEAVPQSGNCTLKVKVRCIVYGTIAASDLLFIVTRFQSTLICIFRALVCFIYKTPVGEKGSVRA